MLLRQMGIRAVAYRNAEAFMHALVPVEADTVIVDIGLPGMSGAQLIRWLASLEHPPRVVAMSGMSEEGLSRNLDGFEVPELLRKPLTQESIESLFGQGT